MKIQSKKALNDDFDGVLFCVLTKLKHAKIVVFNFGSAQTSSEHFRQRSEVFGKSSEICGSSRNVSRNPGDDKVKTQKKLAGIILVRKYRIYSNKRPTSNERPSRISAYPKGRKS